MNFILLADGTDCPFGDWGRAPSIDVIAHSLSQINRFAGHTSRPYSVAEHSLLVAQIAAVHYNATPVVQLACLMHDAHECITGDVSSPVKAVLGERWTDFESAVAAHVRRAFGLQTAFSASGHIVRACDLIALATERRDLMRFDSARNLPWSVLDWSGSKVEPCQATRLDDPGLLWHETEDWCAEFLAEYRRLRALVDQQLAAIPAHQP